MKLALVVIAFLLTTPVLADVYGNNAGCALYLDAPGRTDQALIWFPGDRVEFNADICPITGMRQIGIGAHMVTLSCTNRDKTWESVYLVRAMTDSDDFDFAPEANPGERTKVSLCQ